MEFLSRGADRQGTNVAHVSFIASVAFLEELVLIAFLIGVLDNTHNVCPAIDVWVVVRAGGFRPIGC